MRKINISTSDIKSCIIILLPCSIWLSAACFASYIPVLRTLQNDNVSKLVTYILLEMTFFGTFWCVLFSLLLVLILSFIPRQADKPIARLRRIDLFPYLSVVALFTWTFMHVPAEKVTASDPVEPKDLQEMYIEAFSPDPVLEELLNEADLRYYLTVAGVGLLFLVCFKPFHIHFKRLVLRASELQYALPVDERPATNSQMKEEVEDICLVYGSGEELLTGATRLANTYASPYGETVPFGPDKVAFVYRDDCLFSILKQGYAIPTTFGDGETIESIYEGAFLHINKTLYIRFDHITFFDFDNLKIGVTPELIETFQKFNRPSVREKVWSYHSADHADHCFDIHPDLVTKLKRTLGED